MSKNKNMLVDPRKVCIVGKELVSEYFFDLINDVEGRNSKAVHVTSVKLDVAQKSYLLHWIPRWI